MASLRSRTTVDVRKAEQIEEWTRQTLERFGGIDLLFTNSGGPPTGALLSFDDAAWQQAIDLLLFSTLRMVRAVVPSMRERGGGAILVSTSSSVKEPIANLGLSTVVRASVSALAKTLAIELAGRSHSRQPDHSRARRHGPCSPARRHHWQETGHHSRPGQAEGAREHPARPLRRAARVRARRGVSALGRRRVHDGRHRAGGRRPDQERL